MAKKPKSPTEITSIRHKKDTRVNIPTEELRDFVAEDEKAPKAMLYPRDPSLDPRLVWKGKDEQDASPLEVPVVPVYIQEKVHPQALVENLRKTAKAGEPEPAFTLFDDFNGMGDAARTDAADGGQVSVLPARGFSGRRPKEARLVNAVQHAQPPVCASLERQDRRRSDQSLRRRSLEGVRDGVGRRQT